MSYLAWAIHEGGGVYRYGGHIPGTAGPAPAGRVEPVEQPGDPRSHVYVAACLAVRNAWQETGGLPERVEVEDPGPPPPPAPRQPLTPRPEVVRSGRLRRPDLKPSVRKLAARQLHGGPEGAG